MSDVAASTRNVLSFDVEDWFHLLDDDLGARPERWPALPTIVPRAIDTMLAIADDAGVRATFFVLGWVAARYPRIAPAIQAAGHEVASHSYWHRPVSAQSEADFLDDLRRSVEILEQQTGCKVLGFRAPGFCARPHGRHALEGMAELGLLYDASLVCSGGDWPRVASRPDGAGSIPDFERSGIRELPLTVFRFGRVNLRFSGGGYFRVLPRWAMDGAIRYLNRRGVPAMVYLHPRDLVSSPECPELSGLWRVRACVGAAKAQQKLARLLREHRFGCCADVLEVDRAPVLAGAAGGAS